MAKLVNTKRLLISQANTRAVIVTGAAAFIVIFSLVASKALFSQAAYQNKIISGKKAAVKQLKSDVVAAGQLKGSYDGFVNASQNIIGGNNGGQGAQDGNNGDIVLHALPSTYDFPALATSLEKLISGRNLEFTNISGTDDEVNQSANTVSGTPQAVPIPFKISVTGDYASIQGLIGDFEHSIRPFQIQSLSFTAQDQGKVVVDLSAQTYYQPAKTFNIKKVVQK